MSKMRRALAVVALIVVLFIAGFSIAQWQGSPSAHGSDRPPAGASPSGGNESTHIGKADENKSSSSGTTQTTTPTSSSSSTKAPGTGDESTHVDKPGDSK